MLRIQVSTEVDALKLMKLMNQHLTIKGDTPGPFFQYREQPGTHSELNKHLKQVLQFCKFSCSLFQAHRFCIGAASTAAKKGLPDGQIQHLSWLKSDAFKRYIRLVEQVSRILFGQLTVYYTITDCQQLPSVMQIQTIKVTVNAGYTDLASQLFFRFTNMALD